MAYKKRTAHEELGSIQRRAKAILKDSHRDEYLDTGVVLDFLNDIKRINLDYYKASCKK